MGGLTKQRTRVCVLELPSGMTGYVAYSRSGPWLFGLYLSIRLTKDGVWAEQDRQRDRYFRYQIKQFLNRNSTNYFTKIVSGKRLMM